MKDKLIRRAAMRYREWLVSETQSPISSGRAFVMSSLHRVKHKSIQMEAWAERFFRGSTQRAQFTPWDGKTHKGIVCSSVYERLATNMIPELSEDVIASARHAAALLKSLVTKEVITVISPKEAIEEIRAIVQAWPETEFRGNVLSVMIKDVSLSDEDGDVDLGSFWMHVDLTCPLDSLRIESIDCVESSGGYHHPHVSGSKLCIGAGGLTSQDALCQGRLEDCFRIIEAVLRTYNSHSIHEALNEWYDPSHEGQFYCERCEEWRSDESSSYCEGCETNYCEYCDMGGGCCTECSDWRCGDCSTTCQGCEETLCKGCGGTCCNCDNSMCTSCLSECTVCGDHHCESCGSACSHCGDSVCGSCTTTCSCCEDACCVDCVDEECSECGGKICKGCQTTCDECNKTVCNKCNDNPCEHCGTPMCGPCNSEHNCLLAEITHE